MRGAVRVPDDLVSQMFDPCAMPVSPLVDENVDVFIITEEETFSNQRITLSRVGLHLQKIRSAMAEAVVADTAVDVTHSAF